MTELHDRAVAVLSRDGRPAHRITITRDYPAPLSEVWDAITDRERLSRWFAPVSGDLRLGGRYQIEGNAGGLIEACEPQRRIAVTWEFGGQVSWVEVMITPLGERTQVQMHHAACDADLPPGFWDQYGPGATGVGWDIWFMSLSLHLATPDRLRDPGFEARWAPSPEGVAYVTASAEGWAAAAIAGGEDAAAMQATVPHLIAFYTGIPMA